MSQWRTRAFYLTRNRVFLAKVALGILAVFALAAVAVHQLQGTDRLAAAYQEAAALMARKDPKVNLAMHLEEYRLLRVTSSHDPQRLVRWLKWLSLLKPHLRMQPQTAPPEPGSLVLGGLDLGAVIRQHTDGEAQQGAFAAYVKFCLADSDEGREVALTELKQRSEETSAPRHANELLAEALEAQKRPKEEMRAWMREGMHADAEAARAKAFLLALELKDEEALTEMTRNERYLKEVNPHALKEAAFLLKDWQLRLWTVGAILWERWMQSVILPIALLTAGIWYGILVYTGSSERLRWLRYLPAVGAGVASVTLLLWVQESLDYKMPDENGETVTPTHAMMDWVLNVGLPEELAKMVCFAIFLPVLLQQRSAVKAALTGGCVGLGFALDENLLYLSMSGSVTALQRLLTANFLHIALTGIVGWSLYELFRSRFNKATEFLTAFAGAVVAHGLYNFSATIVQSDWGLEIMHLIIVAASAHFYLRLLQSHDGKTASWVVSRTAIFTWGLALLIGLLMVVATSATMSLTGITMTLKSALSMAILAYLFVREFREV